MRIDGINIPDKEVPANFEDFTPDQRLDWARSWEKNQARREFQDDDIPFLDELPEVNTFEPDEDK